MCCLIFTRRGLAYFGVLVQLLVGLMLIPLISFIATVSVGSSRDGTGRRMTRTDITFMVVYALGLCSLGVLIFKAIRSESLRLLYISIASFAVFQTLSGVTTILTWNSNSYAKNSGWSFHFGNFSDYSRLDGRGVVRLFTFGLSILCTVVYLGILICYTRNLRRRKLNGDNSGDNSSSSSYYSSK